MHDLRRTFWFAAPVTVALAAVTLQAMPASAGTAERPSQPTTTQVVVKEALLDPVTEKPVAVNRYNSANQLVASRLAGRSGGPAGYSAPRGCRRLTVIRREMSTLHTNVLFDWITWTQWCWDKHHGRIYNKKKGWDYRVPAWNWSFEGMARRNAFFYRWKAGRPLSGHYNWKKGHFRTCLLIQPLCSNKYPDNKIWVHSDGTAYWSSTG